MITATIEQITPYERAVILYNKYTKEYNRTLCMGTMQQTEHWKEVTMELAKLYKNK
jgi:hypothetical protein